MADKEYAKIKKKYAQPTVKKRIEALFLDNIGRIVTRQQIIKVATDPATGKPPENWHQRLSELRTDDGYAILSWRNQGYLQVSEYLMPSAEKRASAGKRVKPDGHTWEQVLERASYACEWAEGGKRCGLKPGEND